MNQLREVNNYIKHGGEISQYILNIEEFKTIGYFTDENLERFHNRIIDPINTFIDKLSEEIYNERFILNEKKIENLAQQLRLRLDPEYTKLLVEKLLVGL